jgi:hypothetical protein
MPGTMRARASLGVIGQHGPNGTFDVDYSQSVATWTGVRHLTLGVGAVNQSLIEFGVGGLTTLQGVMIVADQDIGVTLGFTGSNVAITLKAGAPLLLAGILLTALAISNQSAGPAAQVEYAMCGV